MYGAFCHFTQVNLSRVIFAREEGVYVGISHKQEQEEVPGIEQLNPKNEEKKEKKSESVKKNSGGAVRMHTHPTL